MPSGTEPYLNGVDGEISDISMSSAEMKKGKSEEISLFGIEGVVNPDKVKRNDEQGFKKSSSPQEAEAEAEAETEPEAEPEPEVEADDEAETKGETDVDKASHRAASSSEDGEKKSKEEHSETRSIGSRNSRRSANYQEYNFFRGRSSNPPNNEEDFRQKTELLSEWDDLVRKTNERHSKNLNLNSSTEEIKYEIEKIKYRRRRENAVKFMGRGTFLFSKLVEFLTGQIHFFDVDWTGENNPLDGWSTSVKHNITDYDEVFEELYEKYKGATSGAPPELKFLMLFTMSAVQFALINQAPRMITKFMSSKKGEKSGGRARPQTPTQYRKMTPPSMDDIEDDPELEELLYDVQNGRNK